MDDLDVVRALEGLSVPESLAQRHLARLEAARVGGENVVPLRSPRRRALRASAAGVVVGAFLVSGAGVAAASTSLPGDPLYGIKTSRERVQLSMTRPGESRARLELRLARTRLGEAAALLRSGDVHRAVTTLARADAALASASAQGGDEVDAQVAGELDRRIEVLGGLLDGGLPETAADAAREAVERALDRGGAPRGNGPAVTPPGGGQPSQQPPADPPGKSGDHRPDHAGDPNHPDHPGRRGPSEHPTGRPTAIPSQGAR